MAFESMVLGAIGVFAGIVSVTSGGGATAAVPLVLLLGYPSATTVVAVMTALLASFITGIVTYRHLPPPQVKLPMYVWPMSLVGSIVGAHLVIDIDPFALRLAIVILLSIVIVLTLALKPDPNKPVQIASKGKRLLGTCIIFLLCVYLGFFGAGFGTFLILTLMHFWGYTFLQAVSAGTRFSLVMGSMAFLTYLSKGAVNFQLAIPLGVGASFGGFFGAKLAQLVGDRWIRMLFLCTTSVLTVKMLYDLVKR